MASLKTMLMLVAFAVMAGVLVQGGNAEDTPMRRRLAGHAIPAAGAAAATNCIIPCSSLTPTCCQLAPPFTFLSACFATSLDIFNCGTCGNVCPSGALCCSGKCINRLTDSNNCGSCGNKCTGRNTCRAGFCGYSG